MTTINKELKEKIQSLSDTEKLKLVDSTPNAARQARPGNRPYLG